MSADQRFLAIKNYFKRELFLNQAKIIQKNTNRLNYYKISKTNSFKIRIVVIRSNSSARPNYQLTYEPSIGGPHSTRPDMNVPTKIFLE